MKLTELDKTILLAFLVLTKGKEIYVDEPSIVLKFRMRQRPMVRRRLKRLVRERLLLKHPKERSYRLSKTGLKQALKILHEGAKLWTIR